MHVFVIDAVLIMMHLNSEGHCISDVKLIAGSLSLCVTALGLVLTAVRAGDSAGRGSVMHVASTGQHAGDGGFTLCQLLPSVRRVMSSVGGVLAQGPLWTRSLCEDIVSELIDFLALHSQLQIQI